MINTIKYLRMNGARRNLIEGTHMILGITGGIGCGKSTVAALLGRLGFSCLDSDALIRNQVFVMPAVKNPGE